MDQQEKSNVIKRYTDRLKQFGYGPEALGWDKHRHNLRYHILLSQWELKGDSILDFGCGFGDMCQYIQQNEIVVDYHGVDINPDLIEQGTKQFPDCSLECIDFLEEHQNRSYDYIFSSGVHNFKIDKPDAFIEKTFEVFHSVARKGFAINFMSSKVEYEHDHLHHSHPATILELAYKYGNRVVLRNDYMPFEFTVFVNKRNDFDQLAVYEEYRSFCQ